ncbi:hypothetical protein [Armatimonas sp.]|uniref:hypothetical protein n=1 Tax=Armatimonas sp. TaxID=1872638 RepID=UPI00374CA612
MANDMIKLGGLWTNKDKNGDTYLTGKLSPGVKILIFKNQYRESENHPTHIMYLTPVETQSQVPEGDEFDTQQAPRNTYAAPREYAAPEDYAEPAPAPARPMAPRSAAPAARPPARAAGGNQGAYPPRRGPAPPPDYNDDDLSDPFAE